VDEKRDREGAVALIANLQSSNVLYADLASIASVSRRRIGAIPLRRRDVKRKENPPFFALFLLTFFLA
jgi:hypothetical protein